MERRLLFASGMMITRCLLLTIAVATFASGCGLTTYGRRAPTAWDFSKGDVEQLYAANRIDCSGSSCTKGGKAFEMDGQTGELARYPEAQAVLDRKAARDYTMAGIIGVGAAAVLGGAYVISANHMGRFNEFGEVGPRPGIDGPSAIVVGSGAVVMGLGWLVGRFWDPAEELDEAYNAGLRRELESAYAAERAKPGAVAATR